MKHDEDDLQFGKLLKQESYPATDNSWFTRRVLNRLPARHHRSWFMTAVYVIVALVCALSWRSMIMSLDGTVTVRDMLYMAIMALVTMYAIVSAAATVIRTE